jgi:hypothetical protein
VPATERVHRCGRAPDVSCVEHDASKLLVSASRSVRAARIERPDSASRGFPLCRRRVTSPCANKCRGAAAFRLGRYERATNHVGDLTAADIMLRQGPPTQGPTPSGHQRHSSAPTRGRKRATTTSDHLFRWPSSGDDLRKRVDESKVKYTCGCAHAWGKPGLSIKCLLCGNKFALVGGA